MHFLVPTNGAYLSQQTSESRRQNVSCCCYRVRRHVPGLHHLPGVEAHLENLGAPEAQVFPLARQFGSLLDGGQVSATRLAAPPPQPSMRSGT